MKKSMYLINSNYIFIIITMIFFIFSGSGCEKKLDNIYILSHQGMYGKVINDKIIKKYNEIYSSKLNVKIKLIQQNSSSIISYLNDNKSRDHKIDIVNTMHSIIKGMCGNIFRSDIDFKKILKIQDIPFLDQDDFIDNSFNECGVKSLECAIIVGFNKTIFNGTTVPTSINDLFDTKKFPGKRILMKSPKVLLEWALLADGVPYHKLYTTLSSNKGIRRALKMLGTIRDSIIWAQSYTDTIKLLKKHKNISMIHTTNGRLQNIINEKKEFEIIWENQAKVYTEWAITSESLTNINKLLHFIAFAMDPYNNGILASNTKYNPVRSSALEYVSHENFKYIPYTHSTQNSFSIDSNFWKKNFKRILNEFIIWSNSEVIGE